MPSLSDVRWSTIRPSKPTLTNKNLDDQTGKVFIVTGGSGGLGAELGSILYQHNARIYLTARSQSKVDDVIAKLKVKYPQSKGELLPLIFDLEDLSTIKDAANQFLSRENRLDVLWNNAGVMIPPQGSKTKQGHELQLGVNNLGHHLFTHFLVPILKDTAAKSPKDSVRVIWVSSSAADNAPRPPIDFSNMDYHEEEGVWAKYSRSKAGNAIQASEFARRTKGSGIVSIALNPGNFVTNLQKNMPAFQLAVFKLMASEPIDGAHTELFAGLDKSIGEKDNGGWIVPFGKLETIRKDLAEPEIGTQFWEWCDQQTKAYY